MLLDSFFVPTKFVSHWRVSKLICAETFSFERDPKGRLRIQNFAASVTQNQSRNITAMQKRMPKNSPILPADGTRKSLEKSLISMTKFVQLDFWYFNQRFFKDICVTLTFVSSWKEISSSSSSSQQKKTPFLSLGMWTCVFLAVFYAIFMLFCIYNFHLPFVDFSCLALKWQHFTPNKQTPESFSFLEMLKGFLVTKNPFKVNTASELRLLENTKQWDPCLPSTKVWKSFSFKSDFGHDF